jgi:hypothetical protein
LGEGILYFLSKTQIFKISFANMIFVLVVQTSY